MKLVKHLDTKRPLSLMVQSKYFDCMSSNAIDVWNVLFENPFVCSVTEEYLNEILGFRNDTHNDASMDSCQVVLEFCLVKRSVGATISKYFIISLAVFHLVKELFQITQVGQKMLHQYRKNFTESLCSRNFQNVKLWLDFLEIWLFYRHSNFAWN